MNYRELYHQGMSLADAERAIRRLGGHIKPRRGTGERVASLPNGRRVTYSARRKDSTRALVSAINSYKRSLS